MSAIQKPLFAVEKYLPYIFLIAGILGFLASFILTVDTIKILQDPSYTPPCNISPIISCGSVMKTDQAAIFGFMNSLIGIAVYASLAVIGLVLFAGAKFKRWFWYLLQGAAILTVIFVHYLIFQSLYRIGSLCPFCMVVWSVTMPSFWYLTLYNLKNSQFSGNKFFRFAYRYHGDFLLAWFVLIVGLILNRFWYYWSALF